MAAAPAISPDHGFLDCPFDDEYTETFRAKLLGEQDLLVSYRALREELPTLAERLGLDPAGLTYADFDQILSG